jgi:hypothetical protein
MEKFLTAMPVKTLALQNSFYNRRLPLEQTMNIKKAAPLGRTASNRTASELFRGWGGSGIAGALLALLATLVALLCTLVALLAGVGLGLTGCTGAAAACLRKRQAAADQQRHYQSE